MAFDPDEQVQAVIRLIFTQFERLGTLHAVLRYLVDHDVQLGIRLREGPDKGTLEWRRPNRMTLQTLLHNPAYAGIYAYGRRRVDPRRQDPAVECAADQAAYWAGQAGADYPDIARTWDITEDEARLRWYGYADEADGEPSGRRPAN